MLCGEIQFICSFAVSLNVTILGYASTCFKLYPNLRDYILSFAPHRGSCFSRMANCQANKMIAMREKISHKTVIEILLWISIRLIIMTNGCFNSLWTVNSFRLLLAKCQHHFLQLKHINCQLQRLKCRQTRQLNMKSKFFCQQHQLGIWNPEKEWQKCFAAEKSISGAKLFSFI